MKKSKFSNDFPTTARFLLLPFFLALATACGSESEEPEPTPTNPWVGHTYLLDITEGNWTQPRGIGAEIDDFVPSFLIHVEGDAPDSFDVVMGTASIDGVQDTCNPTSRHLATANPPAMSIGPTEFPLHVQHVEQPIAVDGIIYDLTLTDVLPDGENMEVGVLTATMDFRELYPLLTILIDPDPDTACAAFAQRYPMNGCTACPTDGEPYCLNVKAEYLTATLADGEVEPVDQLDPSCTPMP